MRTVFKYTPEIKDIVEISVPVGAKLLKIGQDPGGQLAFWFEIEADKSSKIETRTFYITGTGMIVPDDAVYVDSAVCGRCVWHVWKPAAEPIHS